MKRKFQLYIFFYERKRKISLLLLDNRPKRHAIDHTRHWSRKDWARKKHIFVITKQHKATNNTITMKHNSTFLKAYITPVTWILHRVRIVNIASTSFFESLIFYAVDEQTQTVLCPKSEYKTSFRHHIIKCLKNVLLSNAF